MPVPRLRYHLLQVVLSQLLWKNKSTNICQNREIIPPSSSVCFDSSESTSNDSLYSYPEPGYGIISLLLLRVSVLLSWCCLMAAIVFLLLVYQFSVASICPCRFRNDSGWRHVWAVGIISVTAICPCCFRNVCGGISGLLLSYPCCCCLSVLPSLCGGMSWLLLSYLCLCCLCWSFCHNVSLIVHDWLKWLFLLVLTWYVEPE